MEIFKVLQRMGNRSQALVFWGLKSHAVAGFSCLLSLWQGMKPTRTSSRILPTWPPTIQRSWTATSSTILRDPDPVSSQPQTPSVGPLRDGRASRFGIKAGTLPCLVWPWAPLCQFKFEMQLRKQHFKWRTSEEESSPFLRPSRSSIH